MKKWGMKNTIGRPFIVSNSQHQLEDQLFQIADVHPLIEIIPAHVMTPDGILGSKNDLRAIGNIANKYNIAFHCDAVQLFGKEAKKSLM